MEYSPDAEWLEPDGMGGFASGTVRGVRTRRYHALLLTATTPPTGRVVLVNGFDAWITTPAGRFAISSQAYPAGVIHPDGASRLVDFALDPWPTWRFRLEDGTLVRQELFVPRGSSSVVLSWKLLGPRPPDATLAVRPFLSGRDYHSLQRENAAYRFQLEWSEGRLTWHPYEGLPPVVSISNGTYAHEPAWYRDFHYAAEQERGLDAIEDLASPGILTWDLSRDEAWWILAAGGRGAGPAELHTLDLLDLREAERRRRDRIPTRWDRAADVFLVTRGAGRTILAGYPWFTDWGRDTFVALRGLCLATGRLREARDILLEWAPLISGGMIPNVFPDGGPPQYNSVDASLWFVVAVGDFLRAMKEAGSALDAGEGETLSRAVFAILDGYTRGARFGIRCDEDGLLGAGQPGMQLTWMDARVDGKPVTPRIGKPVEVQALWVNALAVGATGSGETARWEAMMRRALDSFGARFWNAGDRCLYDVIDVDHETGAVDSAIRPNQVLAVGGLPVPLMEGPRAAQVVDTLERRLLTPLGLKSLDGTEPEYAGRYTGGPRERDAAYHQGTVWPWLTAAFVEAWLRARGGDPGARRLARERFLLPLLAHLNEAGLGSISEIADGDPPHTPRGAPFQAWSVGEAIRLDRLILREAP